MDYFDLRVGKLSFSADGFVNDDYISEVINSRLYDHYIFVDDYHELSDGLTLRLIDFSVIKIDVVKNVDQNKEYYNYFVRFYYEVIYE